MGNLFTASCEIFADFNQAEDVCSDEATNMCPISLSGVLLPQFSPSPCQLSSYIMYNSRSHLYFRMAVCIRRDDSKILVNN